MRTWSCWRWLSLFMLLAGCVGAVASCTNQAPGIAPNPNQIHYPVGIAVHPSGKYLYVANSNFDLAFTGGTVMAFSTEEDSKVVVDRAGIRTEVVTLKQLQGSTVSIGSFAGQILINREGSRAYVAVRQDRRTGTPVDLSSITAIQIDASQSGKGHLKCNEKAVKPEQTGGVGEEDKFELQPPPRCGDVSKVFLDDSPYPYSMALVSSCQAKKTCKQDSECDANQRCDDQRCVPGCGANSCKTGQTCKDKRCTCIRQLDCPTGQVCRSGSCYTPGTTSERFCSINSDCQSFETCKETRLLATHIERGGLSEYSTLLLDNRADECKEDKDCKDKETCLNSRCVTKEPCNTGTDCKANETCNDRQCVRAESARKIISIPTVPSGITSLALLPNNPLLGTSGNIFLTSNQDNSVWVLPPQLPPSDNTLFRIPFSNTDGTSSSAPRSDLRGVAVGYDKKNRELRMFVAARLPTPAVIVYRLLKNDKGELDARLLTFVPVGNGPSQVVYRSRPAPQADLLYVVCSREGRVDVINVETSQVVHQIKVGVQPAFLAIYEPTSTTAVQRRRAYVSNFLDTSISIINLDNHRVIGQVVGIDTRQPLP